MGFLTWSETAGKIWAVIIFLVILTVIFLIVSKVVPEMQFVAGVFERWGA